MATPETETLKSQISKLDPKRATLIRQLYYQVADALPQLAEELEFADLDIIEMQDEPETYNDERDVSPLLDQHMVACRLLDVFRQLQLGKYL